MNPQMTQTLGRAKGLMEGFTPGQRSVVIVGAIALLMGAFALSRWVSQPTYTVLYGNLSGADTSAVVEQLASDGVKYQLADGGNTVMVPQDQVAAVRVALSGQGLPSGEGDGGWSLLDQQGITATDFQQNIAYQRAIEGELSKTLQAMNGVNTAVVHLAVPKKDVFSEESDRPTSSVLLALSPGTTLSSEQTESISHLVAGSVAGLDPKNVTITDQTGRMLSGGGSGGGGGAGAASKSDEYTAAFEERMGSAAQRVLDSVVGPGNSVVRVNAQLNFDSTEGTTKRYERPDPEAPPLNEATVTEEFAGNGNAAGGALGAILPPAVGAENNGTYSREQATRNNSVNETVTRTSTAPGGVRRMTVAVVLDAETAGALDPAQIQQLVANAVGLDPARGDVVQVDTLPFDDTAAAAATEELAAAAKAAQTARYIEIAKQVGLGLLVLIILFLVLKRRKKEAPPVIDATASDLPVNLLPRQPAALESSNQLAITAETFASRDRMRDDVAALVDNQPDDVAQMLQGWLSERKS